MDTFNQRIIFFGGKGGVGKTTCASAFALLASQKNRKTLLVSTDPAHSLSDIFERQIGHHETQIQPGLFGLEIDPDREAQNYIQTVKAHVQPLIDPDSMSAFNKQLEFVSVSPGVQEAALFDKITELITRKDNPYDLLVFDTAPTGQTLRLLTLPDLMGSWTRTLAQRREKAFSFWKVFSRMDQKPVEEDPVLKLLNRRREKFENTRTILMDSTQTGFYLVLLPEKLPILETRKAVPVLKKYGIPIRGMIVNRLLPEKAEGAFLKNRKHQECLYLKEIETLFRSYKPVYLYQREADVMNLEGLKALNQDLEAILGRG